MGLFNSVQGINQSIGAAQSAFGALGAASTVAASISNAINGVGELRMADLPDAGEAVGDVMSAVSAFGGGGDAPSNDWRVRLSLPSWPAFKSSPVLAPLKESGGLIFPFTPQISITQSANYTPISPVHSNFSFQAYKNSDPGTITITAPMYCEDSKEALYWIAALHYLRSATKMFSGNDPKAGNPPPIVKLNAYGNYVFHNVPVVVKSIQVTMDKDCDYIGCNVVGSAAGAIAGVADSLGGLSDMLGLDGLSSALGGVGQVAGLLGTFGVGGSTSGGVTHVPTKSTFVVTLVPVYSRTSSRKFSLDQFVTGGYMTGGTGYV